MKSIKTTLLVPALALVFATAGHAATVIPITSFNPNTFFAGGVLAGLDFNSGTSPTQAGFLGVAGSNNKTYSLTTNSITIDISVTNANQANQNRNRNNANAGDLITDFEQWYGRNAAGGAVEAAFNISGLQANTKYEVSFFTFNVGAGQSTHEFYDGTSSAAPLITSFTTAGNQNNYSTWVPGITIEFISSATGTIDVTILAPIFVDANGNADSRLTFNGMSVIPEPTAALLGSLGMLLLLRRRR